MDRLGRIVSSVVDWLWRCLRVLWVCRAATVSALLGGVMIIKLEQARDLFADTGLTALEWGEFYAFLFVWAWLVHGMGRRALQFDDWVPEAHREGGLTDDDRARLREQFKGPAIWIPRVLGAFVFVATALALWQTRQNLSQATGLDAAEVAVSLTGKLLIATALVGALYLGFVANWRKWRANLNKRDMDAPLLAEAQSVLRLLVIGFVHPRRAWAGCRPLLNTWLNCTLIVLALIVTIVFLEAVFQPASLAAHLPRAVFLPVLLGGGLLLFGEIASLSHRYMTPLLICFFVVGAVLGYLLTHYNDVRWIGTPRAAAATASITGTQHQLGMSEAIERWRTDNNCRDSAADCPRPIVIAGAGGASRAGFFTATVVGAMLDAGAQDREFGNIRSRIFALSTVSGSSVGAVMMRAAWMDALQNKSPDKPPCLATNTPAWFGDGGSPADKAQASSPWRDCFQKLMAGDFLSPVFVGLAYRDLFPFGGVDRSGLLERSFERWYRKITANDGRPCEAGDDTGLCRPLGHLPDRPDPTKPGDWIPLLFINGTSVATGRRIIVSDVRVGCVMDGDTGHRFLEYSYDYRELRDPRIRTNHSGCSDALADAGEQIDLRLSTVSLMSARFPIISTQGVIWDLDGKIVDSVVDGGYFENDGLATAADIVRELQTKGLQPIVIRIVNEPDPKLDLQPAQITGGATAYGGAPQPLKVSTQSESNRLVRDGEPELMFPPLPQAERGLFDSLTSIGRALYATRSGHEDGHLDYLRGTLAGPLTRIGVDVIDPAITTSLAPEPSPAEKTLFCRSPLKTVTSMEFVSMSWWLSQPVQAYLDAQLCRPQIDRLICVLKQKQTEVTGSIPASNSDPCQK
jgi:hypothetical protein